MATTLRLLTDMTAIDVWSAGMILLFFLTKKFPLFQSNDDTEALLEIAAIIGRRRMEKTATLHSKLVEVGHVARLTRSPLHRPHIPVQPAFSVATRRHQLEGVR